MKKTIALLSVLSLVVLSGCAMVSGPAAVTGFLFSDVKTPGEATGNTGGSKKGSAECVSILGLVANGDASVDTAAKNGGITKIKTVDYKIYSVLGIYAKLTTVVTGE